MKSETAARHLRRELDARLKEGWLRVPRDVPKRGWIRNVREALGLSSSQLAKRMKISQSGVVALEQSEGRATIQLASLRRAAKALGCDLVYGFVPKEVKSLDSIIKSRKEVIAMFALAPILKGTKLTAAERRVLTEAYAEKIKWKRVWE